MAMRRPRIKAAALLTTKRKSRDVKSEQATKPVNGVSLEDKNEELAKDSKQMVHICEPKNPTVANKENSDLSPSISALKNKPNQVITDNAAKETIEDINKSLEKSNKNISNKIISNQSSYDTSFKCPARIEYTRSNSQITPNVPADDVFYNDMEESILQLDMQKSVPEKSASPLKQQGRQRIRPVPLFQRRNSYANTANPVQVSSEDTPTTLDIKSKDPGPTIEGDTAEIVTVQKINPLTHRRERHYSASMIQSSLTTSSSTGQHHFTPHKFTPAMGLSRIRTESNCSAFSDSFVTQSKLRKNDEHTNRPYSRRDFSWRMVNGHLDKSSLKMFDLIYYNPVTNPMEKRTAVSTIKKESTIDENDVKHTAVDSKVELTEGSKNAMPVPQLKLNANGDLILDEKTLEIETTAEQEARKVLANSSLIFLDENTGMNGFYKRQKRTKEWPPEETIKFYRCLQTVGTDFSLMCQLFPKRTRRDLKLKFKKEERSNLALINKALLYPKLFNIDDLKAQLETEEREREEALQRWKEIHAKEAKAIKKVKISGSTAARSLKNGDDVYENENVVKRKLSRRGEKKKTESAKRPKVAPHQLENPVNDDPKAIHLKKQKLLPNQNVLHDKAEVVPPAEPVKPTTILVPTISTEIRPVKLETAQPTNYVVKTEHFANYEINFQNSRIPKIDAEEFLDVESRLDQIEEFITYITPNSSGAPDNSNEMIIPNNEDITNYEVPTTLESKTFVDLDDGTVNTLEEGDDLTLMDAMPATPMSVSHRDLDECDIQQILIDLADGSLVLVSTLEPDNPDQVVNEIYMMDKTTGELCDKPLDIPESIVQGVLSVMN
ncbi:transcription factor TFIIIB component B'' homolog [Rhagoletis pomonella]|uniref:transcription factor TFIIIB component B'' homolog n=1 Tax=Rhagoletis pomonella TaxID=28610 RepID=UPI00178051F3|nr:transcription factor TFIIIB component B'' homolog [Rhagoletis pomonella]